MMAGKGMMAVIAGLVVAGAVFADGEDPVRVKLNAAKKAFDSDVDNFGKPVLDSLEKRDAAARKDGNKTLVDQIKAERREFEEHGVYPADLPAKVREDLASARLRVAAAHRTAIKEYLVKKQDGDAAIVEKEWKLIQAKVWPHLNLLEAVLADDGLQLGKEKSVSTVKEYSGSIEITVIARTENENIRLHAYRGACVIFNWESNAKELRVCRPDGNENRESGSIVTAKVVPLKPKVWHRLKWIITTKGMKVYADDQLVFSETKAYDLSKSGVV